VTDSDRLVKVMNKNLPVIGLRMFLAFGVSLLLTAMMGCGGGEENVAAPSDAAAASEAAIERSSDALPASVVDSVSADSITAENAEEMLKKLEGEINATDSL